MQLNVTFRQMDSSDFLKEYAKEKVERVNKYLERAGEANVVFSLERHLHHADITIHSGRFVLRSHEKSEDMYASIDLAMDKIERQLRRYKEKLKHHHNRQNIRQDDGAFERFRAREEVLDLPQTDGEEALPADSAAHRVVATTDVDVRVLSVEEAAMQLDLMHAPFLVFQNAETRVLNVIYRRHEDGKLGLITTQQPRP